MLHWSTSQNLAFNLGDRSELSDCLMKHMLYQNWKVSLIGAVVSICQYSLKRNCFWLSDSVQLSLSQNLVTRSEGGNSWPAWGK